jgi:ATP-binding cassette subfamily C protein
LKIRNSQYYKLAQFAKYFLSYSGKKFFVLQLLELFNNSIKGAGILLILPLLNMAGYLDQQYPGTSFKWLEEQIQSLGVPINIYTILLFYLGLNSIAAVSLYAQSLTEVSLQQGFLLKIRTHIYRSLLKAEWKHLVTQEQGNITFATTTDIQQVNQAGYQFLRSIRSFIQLLIGIILCAMISAKLTILACATGSIYIVIQLFFIRKTLRNATENRHILQQLFGNVTESFSLLKLIKGHASEEKYIYEFQKKSQNLSQQIITWQKLTSLQTLIQTIVITFLIAIYTYVALEHMSIGSAVLVLFIIVLSRITGTTKQAMQQFNMLLKSLPSFIAYRKQIDELKSHSEYDIDKEQTALSCKSHIELRNLSFEYSNSPGHKALHNISVRIEANTTTAIIGPSGAGKTTLVDIILGLMSPTNGSLFVDNTEITGATRRSWRRTLSYVPQETVLNHDSIRNNLLEFAPEANEERIWEVLQTAQAAEFVTKLPNRLDTIVGDRGNRLSGGERQRIALARALLRNPSVLVLDEATSNLDMTTEKAIQKAIDNLHGSMTIIVIAHRLSTVENADKTIEISNGELART